MASQEVADGHGQRRARRRPGENRQRLIEAGVIEFGLNGYYGSATSSIASRAGVPQPHVYANFQTKRDLFLCCAQHTLRDLISVPAHVDTASCTDANELDVFVSGNDAVATQLRSIPLSSCEAMLFQLVSLAGGELSNELQPLLVSFRETVGQRRFNELLLAGSAVLLQQ